MKRLLLSICLLAGLFGQAQAQTFPTYWYWQVADSSPTTQVWEATSGSFVSNTSSNFTTWLSLLATNTPIGGSGLAQTICGATNNGSGAVRVAICPGQPGTGGWTTGQTKTVTGVGGATGANGARTITVIDQLTVDLQGTTFGGTYTSGGVIGAGAPMDTAAHMSAYINSFNVQQYGTNQATSALLVITSTATLTNPLAGIIGVGMLSPSQTVTLPQANLFGGYPIGYPLTFLNSSASSWTLKRSDGVTITAVPQDYTITVYLNSNQPAAGSYVYYFSPAAQLACGDLSNAAASCSTDTTNAANISSGNLPAARLPAAGVNCPSGITAGTVTVVNGQVTHC